MPKSDPPPLGDLRTAIIKEKVHDRLGEFGKDVVGVAAAYAINPAHMHYLCEGLGIRPAEAIDAQLDALHDYILRNGKRVFISRAQYELGEKLREMVLSGAPAEGAPQRLALIDTFGYRGPDRRVAARGRRQDDDRRHAFARVGDKNKRVGRDRRQNPKGRRGSD